MIQHVLFDADGVLQDLPGAWRVVLDSHLGDRTDAYLAELWEKELPLITGKGDYMPALTELLDSYGVTVVGDELYAQVLSQTVPFEESFRVVEACRSQGYGVHLGTNQERRSAAHMSRVLGYDDVFDVSCYSCELGVAKPNAEFFELAARKIGADSGEILFIDDSLTNVEAARAVGVNAVQWTVSDGTALLVEKMKAHGVDFGLVT